MGQPAHILLGEKRRGADRTCLQLHVGQPAHILLWRKGGGPMNLFWQHEAWSLIEGCVSSHLLAGRISRQFNILSLSLCELAIYYTIKYIQTNKQTYLKDGSPYRYETCFLPNSSLSWSKPNICLIFTTIVMSNYVTA